MIATLLLLRFVGFALQHSGTLKLDCNGILKRGKLGFSDSVLQKIGFEKSLCICRGRGCTLYLEILLRVISGLKLKNGSEHWFMRVDGGGPDSLLTLVTWLPVCTWHLLSLFPPLLHRDTWHPATFFFGSTVSWVMWGTGRQGRENSHFSLSFLSFWPLKSTFLAFLLSMPALPVPAAVMWPGSYDTQQQVCAFGCSSSAGCFSLRSGGSPLAGVQ